MEVQKKHTAFAKEKARPGYKKTKLGWIPEEWSLKSLDELGDFSKGKGIAKKDILEDETEGVPCIRYAEIYTLYHYYTESLVSKISTESTEKSNPINYGDILFAGSGETLEDIGKSIAYLGNEIAYAGGDIIILKQNNQNSQYLGYLLNNDVVRNQLFKIGQGHSVVHIYSSGLKKVLVPLPPLPEQQKIASILNTWGKAIAAQEQLIAQKQELKKGLMQELLTGKKRFDGFTEEWEEVKLKDIANFRRGSFPQPYGLAKWYDDDNGMPFVQVYDVDDNMRLKTKTKRKISALAQDQSVFVKKGTVVLTIQGSIGRIAITQYDAYVDRTLLIFQDYKFPVDTVFFTYVVELLFEKEKQIAPGGTIKTITKEKLSNFKLLLPPLEEQGLISKTLTAFEKEITNLKKVLLSTKQQKQGLMQQLLTGEKRLKI